MLLPGRRISGRHYRPRVPLTERRGLLATAGALVVLPSALALLAIETTQSIHDEPIAHATLAESSLNAGSTTLTSFEATASTCTQLAPTLETPLSSSSELSAFVPPNSDPDPASTPDPSRAERTLGDNAE
jgi:hypothetical protein